MAIKEYVVRVEPPPGVSSKEMKLYLLQAICSYAGGLHTNNPLFDLDRESVSVVNLRVTRKKPTT